MERTGGDCAEPMRAESRIEQRKQEEAEDIVGRRRTMADQFKNPKEVKVKEETASSTSSKSKVDQMADKLAGKPAKTEQKFDKENSSLISK
jgi:hypothetical protein